MKATVKRRSDKAGKALAKLDRLREKREAKEAKAKRPTRSEPTLAVFAKKRVKEKAPAPAVPVPAEDFAGKPSRMMDPAKLQPHPLSQLLPKMSVEEEAALHRSIRINGQVEDVVLLDGMILDGRHRVAICDDLGKCVRCVDYDLALPPLDFVASKASHRNMSETQKACASLFFADKFAEAAADRMKAGLPAEVEESGLSRDKAAGLFGVSGYYVQIAKLIREKSKQLFDACFEGREVLTRAKSQIHREQKSVDLKAKATRAKAAAPGGITWTIHEDNSLTMLSTSQSPPLIKEIVKVPAARLIVADPPYNEGLDYGDGTKADKLSTPEYLVFARRWIELCAAQLESDGALIIIINDEWAAEHVGFAKAAGLHLRNWIKWYETFGNNCPNRFNRTSRHILYFTKHKTNVVFHPEVFSRKSARQVVYNDSRAVDAGKLWDDVWAIPRLNDNAAERLPDFETQLPEELILPLVMGLSDPGDIVLDPFSGSGTTVACCVRAGRIGIGIERNAKRAAQSRMRIASTRRDPEAQ